MPRISAAELEKIATESLIAAGAGEEEAVIVSRHLVDSNLAGHDSHGVQRVSQYVRELREGVVEGKGREKVIRDWPTGCHIHGGKVLGQVAGHRAMEHAIEKARKHGIGAATLVRCGHSGRLGSYGEQAAAQGMIGMIFNNAAGGGQWVAPFGGTQGRISPNPFCIAAPTDGDFPVILDISTCVAPEGKVRHALNSRVAAPDGWLIDADGNPTNDPSLLYATPRGALLAFGEKAGHKGFGLAFLVDVLAGALSGAGCSDAESRQGDPTGRGMLFIAIDTAFFTPLGDFQDRVRDLIDYVQSCSPAPGFDSVMVPGEFEHRCRSERSRDGIDVPEKTWEEIRASLP